MMLRVSSEFAGTAAALGAITEGQNVDSGVPGQAGLISLVEASLDADRSGELPAARVQVEAELGAAALVDAAAVIGNFERMTRIADGTGIPLDEPVAAMSADLREDLGINGFGSADRTPAIGWFKQQLFRLLGPMVIRRMARQMNSD